MEKNILGNYFMGLDIGTNSVGWAAAKPDYQLLKAKGHKLWGSRLFEEGTTAEEKRTHRTSRRRLARRNERLNILEELFSEEISKVDPAFFLRLKESKYHFEDKKVKDKSVLFADSNFTDKEFFKKYPTIYALRAELCKKAPSDIRELFLSVHHILKHRGHFLFEGEEISTDGNMEELLRNIFLSLDLGNLLTSNNISPIKELLYNKGITKSDKAKQFATYFPKENKKQMEALAKLVLGLKSNVDELLDNEEYKEILDKDRSLSFKDKDFEEERSKYEVVLQDNMIILDYCKSLYDCILLSDIIPEGLTFSEAKVQSYTTHNKHLKTLKGLLKPFPEVYKKVLVSDAKDVANYVQYSRNSKNGRTCSKDDFYAFLKKELNILPDSKEKMDILKLIDLDQLLPLQKVKDNGVVPYQIHKAELVKILKNAESKYPFLLKKSDDYTVSEKIIKLLEFRIPYYVGPLNSTHKSTDKKGFSWVVRKAPGHVYPWNFSDLIDESKSAAAFITNMTNKCSYLVGEDVLPKNSLLYSEFMLLNELNNIRYDGQPLATSIKESLIEEVFKQEHKKVTVKFLRSFFQKKGLNDKGAFTGFDIDIKSDLKSYRDMVRILGDGFDHNIAEHLVLWSTLFGDAKKILRATIKDNYPQLSDEVINKVCKLRYKDWGSLSAKFLNGIKGQLDKEDVPQTIISYLRDTTFNLMEILNGHSTFPRLITEINDRLNVNRADDSYGLIGEMTGSPAIKRATLQAVKIIEEIVKVQHNQAPQKIFLEVTRTNKAEKKRTNSRKDQLLELYKSIQREQPEWSKKIKEMDAGQFNSKKLYLYYLQQGKCLYSGEKIDLTQLDKYDIDHIYPRSLTKDNSFDNLALVKKELNREKSDFYPIKETIQNKMKAWWQALYVNKFISARKYERLTRITELTADELSGFINRQIVETSQSVKATANILRALYPDTEIVYVKAENVSDFRRDNEFIKVRALNDHHHAKDAYLNIVVGNVYNEKFTKNAWQYVKEHKGKRTYNLEKMFERNLTRHNQVIWDKEKSLETVKAMMASNDVLVTQKTTEGKGALFDATIVKASAIGKSDYLPLKGKDERLSNLNKYGGYTSLTTAYFSIVKGKNKKGVEETHIIGIPLYLRSEFNNISDYENYAKTLLNKLTDIKVIYKKLCSGTLIKYNGFYYRLGGRSGNSIYIDKAVDVILDETSTKTLKAIEKFINRRKIDKNIKFPSEKVSEEAMFDLFKSLWNKLSTNIFLQMKGNVVSDLDKIVLINFSKLSPESRAGSIMEFLNYLNNQRSIINLKELGSNVSRLRLGMNISNIEEFKIITESITGLYRKEINII